MEDLAPMAPARSAARIWCAAVGLIFVLLGVLSAAGLRPGGYAASASAFSLGAVGLIAALTRVTYRQRAVAMVMLGALSALFGLVRSGPALGIDVGGAGWAAARAVAGAALPAALVFRGRYRAYAGARWLLGIAFAVSLPFLVHTVVRIVVLGLGLEQIGAIAVVVAMAASLLGFMGSETTGAGALLATAVIGTLTIELALRAAFALEGVSLQGIVGVLCAAVAFATTSAVTSIGLFQVLAWRLAADARRIDIHTPPKERRRRAPSSADWLG